MDLATLPRRTASKAPPDRGGWNVYYSILDGVYNFNPAGNTAIRGDGKSGTPGWPTSLKLEALRAAWIDADNLVEEKQISEQIQLQLWEDRSSH
jgi:peptide/nickel transport system substrate-binding protein